jgi:hypothetical protein
LSVIWWVGCVGVYIIEGEIRGGSGGGEHDEHRMDYLALIPQRRWVFEILFHITIIGNL